MGGQGVKMETERGLLLILGKAPVEVEDGFNEWYDEDHAPARVDVPGIATARRYRELAPTDASVPQECRGAVPIPDPQREKLRQRIILSGDPPSPLNPPAGCAFHPRCAHAKPECSARMPELEAFDAARKTACLRAKEIN